MNQSTNYASSGKQASGANSDTSHEAEDYWDRLTDDERQLIWSIASGMDYHELGAKVAETPQRVAERYRALILKLGLDDRLSFVLAAVARTAQAPITALRIRE